MAEHKLITEVVTVRESQLIAYNDEPDDSITEYNDQPTQAVRVTCVCGQMSGWAEIGEDLTERLERHVKLSAMTF